MTENAWGMNRETVRRARHLRRTVTPVATSLRRFLRNVRVSGLRF